MSTDLSRTNASPRRRRWWRPQFRLRSLLALMLFSCGLMGWWRWHLHAYHQQQAAVAEVSQKAVYLRFQPGRPGWLQRFADPDVFRDVVHLSFHGRRDVTNDDLKYLAHFRRLKRLSLDRTSVTDEGLKHLKELTELETLSLKNTAVTSAGLANLRELRNMKKLQLGRTQIDGRGLAHLALMTKMEVLELDHLPIADEHLASLQDMQELQTLWLWFSKVRGEGLQHLKPLPKLAELRLYSDLLEHSEFQDWKALQTLMISGPRQAAAKHTVWNCPRLTSLSIDGSSELLDVRKLPRLTTLLLHSHDNGRNHELEVNLIDLPAVKSLSFVLPVRLALHLENISALESLNLRARHLRSVHFVGVPKLRELALGGAMLSQEAIEGLSDLPPLHRLTLNGVASPQSLLDRLKPLDQLEQLSIYSTNLGPEGLNSLLGATNLREFEFSYSAAREGLLEPLAQCERLRRVKFDNVEIQGSQLSSLARLAELRILEVLHCKVSTADFANLRGNSSLQEARFESMQLEADVLETIATWPNLERLHLLKIKGLSQADFSHLARLRKLRQFILWDIGAPAEVLQALSAALPGECQLVYNPSIPRRSGRGIAAPIILQRGVPVDEAESYYSE